MLKKLYRLIRKKDFDNVFKSGKSSFNKVIGIKMLENELKHNRFGIVVSSKVSKKAVERNRIKRRIRAIIKLELDQILSGKDLVIITLPDIREKSYEEIKGAIVDNFRKLKLYS